MGLAIAAAAVFVWRRYTAVRRPSAIPGDPGVDASEPTDEPWQVLARR
jgi:hypothetical protein